MDLRPQAPALPPVVLGPETIARIAGALERAAPVLRRTSYRVQADGGLEISDGEGLDAVRELRFAVDEGLPAEVRGHLGRHSGLGWDVFFGHVVAFWLPQQGTLGFLRALVDRAALHGARLSLHWNRGRQVEAERRPASQAPVVSGLVLGVILAFLLTSWRPDDPVPGILAIGAGFVGGRTWQRRVLDRRCGDALCRSPLTLRTKECPSCGATLT